MHLMTFTIVMEDSQGEGTRGEGGCQFYIEIFEPRESLLAEREDYIRRARNAERKCEFHCRRGFCIIGN